MAPLRPISVRGPDWYSFVLGYVLILTTVALLAVSLFY
jgi:hypothetical protein